MSFSSNSKTPYDFLSMTYNVNTRITTVLIRQSYHPRRHRQESLDENDHRMEACRLLGFSGPTLLLPPLYCSRFTSCGRRRRWASTTTTCRT
jgi:hypothetical protein